MYNEQYDMQYIYTYPDTGSPDTGYPDNDYPDAGYPDRLGSLGKSDQNSTKLSCLENTGCRIKYSTVQCYGF
jgi:hypothetical protein